MLSVHVALSVPASGSQRSDRLSPPMIRSYPSLSNISVACGSSSSSPRGMLRSTRRMSVPLAQTAFQSSKSSVKLFSDAESVSVLPADRSCRPKCAEPRQCGKCLLDRIRMFLDIEVLLDSRELHQPLDVGSDEARHLQRAQRQEPVRTRSAELVENEAVEASTRPAG